jgi:hypothetical protein
MSIGSGEDSSGLHCCFIGICCFVLNVCFTDEGSLVIPVRTVICLLFVVFLNC